MEDERCLDKRIIQRIEEFQKCIKNNDYPLERAVEKFIIIGAPYIFENDDERYLDLKNDIASFLDVDTANIYMVGSAQFGFSISPRKLYKPFDDESDIDIAVISAEAFDRKWKELFNRNYNNKISRTEAEAKDYNTFLQYFFRGWLRPDKFPTEIKDEWFSYFEDLYSKYGYKIRVGLYRDYDFFKNYHISNIAKIREELVDGI